jgi:HK97 family phage major capsid protein
VEKKELIAELEGLKSALEVSISEKAKTEIADQLKSVVETVDAKIAEFAASNMDAKAMETEVNKIKSEQAEILKGFDALQVRVKAQKESKVEKKSFGQLFAEGLEANFDAIQNVKKGKPFRMEMKAVGNMLLSANLTGDGQASYSATQAILPAQKINMRDLIPTAVSPTGLYVQYRETGGEGALAQQTEGAIKGQVDYDFTEVKVVENYIAGFARFSKQMAKQLPYMQTTLPRLLMRDFYKKENALFYATVIGAATGTTTTSETDDIKAIMDLIANTQAANFNASYAVVHPSQLARLNKLLYTNGYYQGSGGVVSAPNGGITIGGTPIISATWATDDKILIIDADYLERVETEALTVEFSMEDSDNFQRNLITARIECQEEINLMLPASAIYTDLGNVA